MEPSPSPAPLPDISSDEWLEISKALEKHHAIFYKLWKLGKPVFTDEIATACVQFDPIGDCVNFMFNPKLWTQSDFYNKLFIICHECLHVILNHGARTISTPPYMFDAVNVAMDVVVNHSLVEDFGFDRSKITRQEELCWRDTVFKGKTVPAHETLEFYYNQLPKGKILFAGLKLLDDHGNFKGTVEDIEALIKKMDGELTPQEKDSLKDFLEQHADPDSKKNQQAGTGVGGWTFLNVGKVVKKKKWETVIQKWARKYLVNKDKDVEQWARLNRRLTCLPSGMFLPSDMEYDETHEEKHQIEVYFFLDTSGSCWSLKGRFFKAAASLPPERFKLRLFCFDTQVRETTLESQKVYGGGGTLFNIIEQTVRKESKGKYPEAVFIITDGYGSTVHPQKPDRWHWFLSSSCRTYIPKDSKVYALRDYE